MKNEEKTNINNIELGNNYNKKEFILDKIFPLKNENNYLKEICSIHQNNIIKYCINCNKYLCVICETEHLNHSLISKKEIQFNNDEIINIQNSIKKYVNTYNELLLEIKLWKKNIDEKIYNFEKNVNNNEIFNLNEIIFNNDLSFNMIIKYRILNRYFILAIY